MTRPVRNSFTARPRTGPPPSAGVGHRFARRLLRWGAVSAACAVGAIGLVQYAKWHAYFAAADIVVETDGRLTREAIMSRAGLTPGMSLVALPARAIERRLRQHPRIRSATVTREFPRRVRVTIRERFAIAKIRRKRYAPAALLDGSGESFASRPGAADDLPYVSGLERLALDTAAAQTVLVDVRTCLSLSRAWDVDVSEIQWDAQRGYTLVIDGRQVVIRLGHSLGRPVFLHLGRVLAHWPADRSATLFDARFADQIVVSPLALNPRGADGGRVTRRL